jgi:hypothetical protein
VNPYGECQHTKYVGCPPCIHEAWEAGYESAQKDAQDAVTAIALACIDPEGWSSDGDSRRFLA